jgi:hypothetical protein
VSPEDPVTHRIEELRQAEGIPVDYGMHLQDWLVHQTTEDSGCPLLDTPFMIMVEQND